MGRRIDSPEDPAFSRLFTDFERSAFRLETLQRYVVCYEAEELAAFLTRTPRPPVDPKTETWTDMIRGHLAAGRSMRRVHVVVEPLSDYLRYELTWGYEAGLRGGEDIRISPVEAGQWPDGIPRHDYWLFDDRDLWLMHYDQDDRFMAAELVDDPDEIARHRHWRDAALKSAIPWPTYMARYPDREPSS